MDKLYKGLLKHFSVKLADNLNYQSKEIVYEKIFQILEEYITVILPFKMENEESELYSQVNDEYEKFENYTVGKLDQNEGIEKKMILLSISRKLFTHSLPLIVAEQCYIKLLRDVRSLIVDTRVMKKQEKAYSLLINLIEDYNFKLLSTKIYWDKPAKRDEYKTFWKKNQEIQKLKDKDYMEYTKQKEILFISGDLKEVCQNENKYCKIIKFYKNRLVSLGVMKELKNSCKSCGKYMGRKKLCTR